MQGEAGRGGVVIVRSSLQIRTRGDRRHRLCLDLPALRSDALKDLECLGALARCLLIAELLSDEPGFVDGATGGTEVNGRGWTSNDCHDWGLPANNGCWGGLHVLTHFYLTPPPRVPPHTIL